MKVEIRASLEKQCSKYLMNLEPSENYDLRAFGRVADITFPRILALTGERNVVATSSIDAARQRCTQGAVGARKAVVASKINLI
jgi:hypothetical protein